MYTSTRLLALFALAFCLPRLAPAGDASAYPLTTCVVSDETLGEHAPPVILDYKGREVRFCCKSCKKDFLEDPATYLKKIDAAAAAQAATNAPPATVAPPAGVQTQP